MLGEGMLLRLEVQGTVDLQRKFAESQTALPHVGRFRRVKAILAAVVLASTLVGILLAAIVLGSILAAVIILTVAVAILIAIGKTVLTRARR
jgi:hypothetical protein